MNKLAFGLVAGFLIGSALSDGFRQTIRDVVGRAARVVVTIVEHVREGMSAGAGEAQVGDALTRDDTASEPENLLDRIDLEKKPALVRERPAEPAAKPEPVPSIDVVQVPAVRKTR